MISMVGPKNRPVFKTRAPKKEHLPSNLKKMNVFKPYVQNKLQKN
jgi:hypothetical protein